MARTRQPLDLELVWRALANPLRRQLLDILADGPRTTGELADRFPERTRFSVMQHLRVLEQGGLVIRRRRGRQRFNHLNPVPIQQIYQRWVRRYQQPWAEALVTLQGDLEKQGATHREGAHRWRGSGANDG